MVYGVRSGDALDQFQVSAARLGAGFLLHADQAPASLSFWGLWIHGPLAYAARRLLLPVIQRQLGL